MAVFRSDRDRQILGERVLGQAEEIKWIHSAVQDVLETFGWALKDLAKAGRERARKESDASRARRRREEALSRAFRLYSWGYGQIERLLQPTWEDVIEPLEILAARERLFPMGRPDVVAGSASTMAEAVGRLSAALEREVVLDYPAEYADEVARAHAEAVAALDAAARAGTEVDELTERHEAAQMHWEGAYAALWAVARGFLALDGEVDNLGTLFRQPLSREDDLLDDDDE